MYSISRWAGRHPWFIRLIALPILFYLQGRIAFVAGANLFFDGYVVPEYWFWGLVGAIWLATYLYPENARALLKTNYWAVKRLELLSCLVSAGLWLFVGNQTACQVEGKPEAPRPVSHLIGAGMGLSRTEHRDEKPTKANQNVNNRFLRAYRAYVRSEIKQLKARHRGRPEAPAISIVAGILMLGFGAIILSCGIQCAGAGGAFALAIAGSIGLFGLGIAMLIGGIRRWVRPAEDVPGDVPRSR